MYCHHPMCSVIPHTPPTYGVIFGLDGEVDIEAERSKLSPKRLAAAVLHVMQYEDGFIQFGATGHVVNLNTGQEVVFDRNALFYDKRFVRR